MVAAYCIYQTMEKIDVRLSSAPRTTLSEFSRDLGMERHAIGRLIKQFKGVSFRKYRKSILLNKALRMIKNGLKNTEIAAKLGYRSAEAFSRFIKLATGMTARDIKRTANGNGGNLGSYLPQAGR